MTRSNLYITLSDESIVKCVADSSSAPEQGYFVEDFLLPLLALSDTEKQMALIIQHCTMDELRVNACYRYEIDLVNKNIGFFEENYSYSKDKFTKGSDIAGRYIAYLKKIETGTERECKRRFRDMTNKQLVARANGLQSMAWYDELTELHRRSILSNGKFVYSQLPNSIRIVNDEA